MSNVFCVAKLTTVKVHDPEGLMSVDGLDLEDAGSETKSDSINDDEEWGGTGGGEGIGPPPPGGKPVKVPAGHELREMKEASELYKSSAFKLQVRIQCSPSSNTSRLTLTHGIDRLVDTERSSEV